jgi:hypothetical protein
MLKKIYQKWLYKDTEIKPQRCHKRKFSSTVYFVHGAGKIDYNLF